MCYNLENSEEVDGGIMLSVCPKIFVSGWNSFFWQMFFAKKLF